MTQETGLVMQNASSIRSDHRYPDAVDIEEIENQLFLGLESGESNLRLFLVHVVCTAPARAEEFNLLHTTL